MVMLCREHMMVIMVVSVAVAAAAAVVVVVAVLPDWSWSTGYACSSFSSPLYLIHYGSFSPPLPLPPSGGVRMFTS